MAEISLTRGMVALVDDEDLGWLSAFFWQAVEGRNGAFYAARAVYVSRREGGPRQFSRQMQRDVLERIAGAAPAGTKADHRNGNTLDNRRRNLRWATDSISNINRGLFRSNQSGYRGVTLDKRKGLYQARLKVNGQTYLGGWHRTAEAAALAYNRLALEHHREHARLNAVPGLTDNQTEDYH